MAQGNAPEDDISVQLEVARTMEKAQDPGDALHLYRLLLRHHGTLREALVGAGRTAFQLGRYAQAKHYLARSLEGSIAEQEPSAELEQSRQLLAQATRLLQLYPSPRLSAAQQAVRVMADRKLAQARLAECTGSDRPAAGNATGKAPGNAAENTPGSTPGNAATPATAAAGSTSGPAAAPAPANDAAAAPLPVPGSSLANPLKNFAAHFARHPAEPAKDAAAATAPLDPLQALADRWQELPANITEAALASDPDLTQTQIQLIYDTEITTRQVCGEPSGDNDLLLKIAQAPNQVEEE